MVIVSGKSKALEFCSMNQRTSRAFSESVRHSDDSLATRNSSLEAMLGTDFAALYSDCACDLRDGLDSTLSRLGVSYFGASISRRSN
jgi:hypothetical protein